MQESLMVKELFDLRETLAYDLLSGVTYPWEALDGISDCVRTLGARLSTEEYEQVAESVWIAKTAQIADTASIAGPVIIGKGTQVRPGAYLRGNIIVGDDAVVGNSTELKNVILFNGVQVPHYNYVGDSILGHKAHMGAGAITSNVKSDKSNVCVTCGEVRIETNRKKFGAMLGDFVGVGCNSVLNPGTVVGAHTNIYPLSMVRGYVPSKSIYKKDGIIVAKTLAQHQQ